MLFVFALLGVAAVVDTVFGCLCCDFCVFLWVFLVFGVLTVCCCLFAVVCCLFAPILLSFVAIFAPFLIPYPTPKIPLLSFFFVGRSFVVTACLPAHLAIISFPRLLPDRIVCAFSSAAELEGAVDACLRFPPKCDCSNGPNRSWSGTCQA